MHIFNSCLHSLPLYLHSLIYLHISLLSIPRHPIFLAIFISLRIEANENYSNSESGADNSLCYVALLIQRNRLVLGGNEKTLN